MTLPTFAEFAAEARAHGFDEVLERPWAPDTVLATHSHPFDARALVVDPKLVIADEPTANLDSENSRMIIDLMREMNQARKVTFVFTTHDQRLLDHVDRKIELRDGNIASDEVMA